jgi:hypothetical protein
MENLSEQTKVPRSPCRLRGTFQCTLTAVELNPLSYLGSTTT